MPRKTPRESRSMLALGLSVSAAFTSACTSPTPDASQPQPPRQAGPFDAQILEAARVYRQEFTRVSDHAHWAPTDCRAPIPSGVLQSASDDSTTHGRKLYFLFAKDADDYERGAAPSRAPADPTTPSLWKAAVGQALVKQSFIPVRVSAGQEPSPLVNDPEHRYYPAEYARDESGAFYRTGEAAALFIMLKTDPATPDTDEGWVYATTTADGQSILSAGRIQSCIGCHEHNTQDRLFGPRWAWPGGPATSPSPARR